MFAGFSNLYFSIQLIYIRFLANVVLPVPKSPLKNMISPIFKFNTS